MLRIILCCRSYVDDADDNNIDNKNDKDDDDDDDDDDNQNFVDKLFFEVKF